MQGEVTVFITRASSQTTPPVSHVEYEVRNDTTVPIWLVNDGWLIWKQEGSQIELSYARGTMRPGSHVFGYFSPTVVQIDPGQHLSLAANLSWPYRLDLLWNAERSAAPLPGNYQISVRVGYGLTPTPEDPGLNESVEAPVLRWQKEAVSQPAPITVPSYQQERDEDTK
ncbi:MAG TPA: hypothetical protein VKU38_05430 [Ktedonobacteraceae bacterium]|nr:hypothetical protein [Ktedonobacteraceae bacterium]